jgi:hypothetical protein
MTKKLPISVSKWLEKKAADKIALAERKEKQSLEEKPEIEIPEHLQFTM